MDYSAQKKICGMCRMVIAADARKCPHCQQFQNRLTMTVMSPWFMTVFMLSMVSVYIALFGFVGHSVFYRGEAFREYADQIRVVSSEIKFGEEPIVAVLGTIQNDSNIDWKELVFQVDFFDADGRVMDSAQQLTWQYHLPADTGLYFKVSIPRQFPQSDYVTHEVKVIAAKDDRVLF